MSSYKTFDYTTNTSKQTSSKVRLDYLDGVRGIAAIYIVIFHIYGEIFGSLSEAESAEIPYLIQAALSLLNHGMVSVAIFILLSGYCLMIPVARSTNGQLKKGLLTFFKRRARRILPPYYAALSLSLLLTALIPKELMPDTGGLWNYGQPSFTPGVLISHLLLLQNLSNDWTGKIDPPMWSVALEWQIYFLFPFLLLPVWRRFGVIYTLAVGGLSALGVYKILHYNQHYWYVFLFTLGMVGAVIGFSKKPSILLCKERIPWDLLSILFFICWTTIPILPEINIIKPWLNPAVTDILLGAAMTCLLISCTRFITEGKKTRFRSILDLFESRWVVGLGIFSYSLYLVHAPILAIVHLYLGELYMSPIPKLLTIITLALPMCLLGAYTFHLIFEKRFMNS